MRALLRPVCRNARIAGHQVSIGGGQAVQLGDVGIGAPVVEPVEPGADLGVVSAVSGGSEQLAQFLFGDVGRQDLAAGVVVDQGVPTSTRRLWGPGVSRAVSRRRRLAYRVLFAAPPAVGRRRSPGAGPQSERRWRA